MQFHSTVQRKSSRSALGYITGPWPLDTVQSPSCTRARHAAAPAPPPQMVSSSCGPMAEKAPRPVATSRPTRISTLLRREQKAGGVAAGAGFSGARPGPAHRLQPHWQLQGRPPGCNKGGRTRRRTRARAGAHQGASLRGVPGVIQPMCASGASPPHRYSVTTAPRKPAGKEGGDGQVGRRGRAAGASCEHASTPCGIIARAG